MCADIESLEDICAVVKDPERCSPDAFVLSFINNGVVIVIRLCVVQIGGNTHIDIERIWVDPRSETGKGHGSHAVRKLLDWALEHQIVQVGARCVLERSQTFWESFGFQRVEGTYNFELVLCDE